MYYSILQCTNELKQFKELVNVNQIENPIKPFIKHTFLNMASLLIHNFFQIWDIVAKQTHMVSQILVIFAQGMSSVPISNPMLVYHHLYTQE